MGPWSSSVALPCAGLSGSQVIRRIEEVGVIRRLVGVDLGIASTHAVRVLAEDGTPLYSRIR